MDINKNLGADEIGLMEALDILGEPSNLATLKILPST
jgi:hypothetical protein